jgi:LPXTG-motif cell wall-anchored protein
LTTSRRQRFPTRRWALHLAAVTCAALVSLVPAAAAATHAQPAAAAYSTSDCAAVSADATDPVGQPVPPTAECRPAAGPVSAPVDGTLPATNARTAGIAMSGVVLLIVGLALYVVLRRKVVPIAT